MQIELVREKETKGTWRYAEDSDQPLIGMLYVPKATLAELGDPERLVLTLQPAAQLAAAA